MEMNYQGYGREAGELMLTLIGRARRRLGNNKRPDIPPSSKQAEIMPAKI
jgi:hypothetical protein